MKDIPHILLINPWIHDFAAYDFWAKPLGLLSLAALLKQHGFMVTYIDCLDRFHPRSCRSNPFSRNGRGPYLKTQISKPAGLEHIPRNYCQYGIQEQWLREDLQTLQPDLILLTGLMSYWYPGIKAVIAVLREKFKTIPLLLGGIYARLCYEHACTNAGADMVIRTTREDVILKQIGELTGFPVKINFCAGNYDTYPYPGFEMQNKINYVVILTSRGCPFKCDYCASDFLEPQRSRRDPILVVEEIEYWLTQYKVHDFVFYDDALLLDADVHIMPILNHIITRGLKVNFHTPNALHVRVISKPLAKLMYQAGFKTMRLGLETTVETRFDHKLKVEEFYQAIANLRNAGFSAKQVGAYLLVGLPDQSDQSVDESIIVVKQAGITPIPAYYSPLPHTRLWSRAVQVSPYDLEREPVFTNNAIMPCRSEGFGWERLSTLKRLCSPLFKKNQN